MKRGYKTYERKQIEYEDDLVIVYDENENQIYKGIEDYDLMKDENWQWDNLEKIYRCGDYIKICLDA